MSIHDTARDVLAFMRAGAALDATGYAAETVLAPTPDLRALCAHLASVAPASLTVYSDQDPPNALRARVGLMCISVHRAAPACFRHRGGVVGTWDGEEAAGAELLRLASIDAPDLTRARANHQPHPAIPVDGERAA
jgi:hypothetical protein